MAEWTLADATQIRANLTKDQEDEISMLYRKVYLQVRKQMLAIPKDGTTSQQIQKQYLDKLHKQLDEAYKSLGIGLEKQIQKEAKKAAQGVVESSKKMTNKLGFKIEGAYSFVPKDVINSLVTGHVYGGNWSLSGAIWADIDKKQSDISKVIAEGLAANKSAYDIAKDLETYVDPKAKKEWDWSKVYPGTSKKVDYNAQRLARTMISHAYQQSLERVCKNNPFVEGFIWQSAHSSRVCPICAERDGQFYKKGELPLDHPNGMCTFIASIQGSMNDVADRLADWANGKSDPELDKWYEDMTGSKATPVFNEEQKKWLEPFGWSPENMPSSTSEFLHSIDFDTQEAILKKAGGSWSDPHPYQIIGKYYEQHLKSVRLGVVPTKIKVPASVNSLPDVSGWISKIRKQTIEHMLDIEDSLSGKMSDEGRGALRLYTGSAYEEINSYLRMIGTGSTKNQAKTKTHITDYQLEAINTAKAALKKVPLTEELYLRRGSSIGELAGFMDGDYKSNKRILEDKSIEELNSMFSGKVGVYHGFTSTSSIWDRGFSGDVECIIRAPKGTQGSSIMRISQYGTGEGETLLNAGTNVRIISVEKSDGHKGSNIRVYMEVIPD